MPSSAFALVVAPRVRGVAPDSARPALVSVLVYAVMAIVGIGLKVNTLPMVALGAGIGVDYGIYLWSRMQEYLQAGDSVHDAYLKTMRVTGASITRPATRFG